MTWLCGPEPTHELRNLVAGSVVAVLIAMVPAHTSINTATTVHANKFSDLCGDLQTFAGWQLCGLDLGSHQSIWFWNNIIALLLKAILLLFLLLYAILELLTQDQGTCPLTGHDLMIFKNFFKVEKGTRNLPFLPTLLCESQFPIRERSIYRLLGVFHSLLFFHAIYSY